MTEPFAVRLRPDERGAWALLDGDREHVTEGNSPAACPRCRRPVFLDTDVDLSFCAFCNVWVGGPPLPSCAPSEDCPYCEARREGSRAPPLSRPLAESDERAAEFLGEVVPSRLMETFQRSRRH
jgi:hypothetical protein